MNSTTFALARIRQRNQKTPCGQLFAMVDGPNADIYCKTNRGEASSRAERDIGNQRKRTQEPTSGYGIQLLGNRGSCENQAAI